MAMSRVEHFQAALSMFQVTPENYNRLYAEMILHVAGVIAEADEKFHNQPSAYEGKTEEEIKEMRKV